MQKRICVLGCGLVGKTIAVDLSKKYYVTAVDKNQDNLVKLRHDYLINTLYADLLEDGKVEEVIENYDLVMLALPGAIAFEILKRIITSGKNVVDISFFPEDPFELDELAKLNNVTAVVDCGLAPGMGNVMLGYHNLQGNVQQYKCYVGGLPEKRELPFEYKAAFSPSDVLEEYTRPTRLVQNKLMIIKEALTDIELLNFEKVGTLEAFNTDGLRTLIRTMPDVPNMVEKTLRYPGHADLIKTIISIGFLSHKPLDINGLSISPLELTSKILFNAWELKPEDKDFTIMRVTIICRENNITTEYLYEVYDENDEKTNSSSMARTTGYTANAVANLILDGQLNRVGIVPPEYIGESKANFDFILDYLTNHNVVYRFRQRNLDN